MVHRDLAVSLLYEFTALSAKARDREAVLEMLLEKTVRVFASNLAAFYRVEDGALTVDRARGIRALDLHATQPRQGYAEARTWCIAEHETAEGPLPVEYAPAALVAVPVPLEDGLAGVLFAARLGPANYDAEEVSLLAAMVEQASVAMAICEARLRDRTQRDALERQAKELTKLVAQLSAPVLAVTAHAVLVPLLGELTRPRMVQVIDSMLRAISRGDVEDVLLDVTGVPTLDAAAASGLLDAARAAELMGARVTVCGINPRAAQALANLDSGLQTLRPAGSLERALAALR